MSSIQHKTLSNTLQQWYSKTTMMFKETEGQLFISTHFAFDFGKVLFQFHLDKYNGTSGKCRPGAGAYKKSNLLSLNKM